MKRERIMNEHLLQKCALFALAAALASLGLTGCKSSGERPSSSEHPAKSDQPKKSEHPEHPR
jgi:hypothetical protein